MKRFAIPFLVFAAACTAQQSPVDDAITKQEAAAMAGKADHIDLCDWAGWYGDGICDEFCAEPDPDCDPVLDCFSSDDCGPGDHCSVDDGDCQSDCAPGFACPAVCMGTCVPDAPDACWGAWVDQNGTCRAPNDGVYPAECCDVEPQGCGGLAGLTCDDGQYCHYEPDQTCGAADQMGECQPTPQICPEIFAPTCGCDGETYSSPCDANGAGVSVAHHGPCEVQAECTSSNDCSAGDYCTVEDGDCLSNCPPGLACPAVCWGTCEPQTEADACWGAWLDQNDLCRAPNDGVYPDHCCDGL